MLSATFQIHKKGKHHKDDDRGKKHDRDDDDHERDRRYGRRDKDDDRDKRHRRGDKDDKDKNDDRLILEFIEIIQDSSGAIIRTLTTREELPQSEDRKGTPEVVSVQLNVTVTSELFHPLTFGAGDSDALIDGAVLSTFTVTLVVVMLPQEYRTLQAATEDRVIKR